MFYREWGLQKMDKAEKFEEMIAVFNSFPLNKDNFNDFYVDTSRIRSVINARSEIINTLKPALLIYIPAVIPAGPPPIIITSYIKSITSS